MAYWRLRVVNEGEATTTYFRVSGVLCPIATPLPSSLSHDRRLKSENTLVGSQNEGRHVWVNPTNEIAISPVYRLVGTNFDGSTKDSNFWTDGSLRDGTVTQANGEINLQTNTTANGLALYRSVRKGRFVAGSAMIVEGAFSWKTALTAGNTRRFGAYTLDESLDVEDGFFFQTSGTTTSLGYARDGSVTLIDSVSFNGNLGLSWAVTADTYYKLSIEYSPMGAFWYVDNKLLHKIKTGHPSAYMTLPITIENENTASSADIEFHCVGAYIARQGELNTNPTYKYIGANGTHVLKQGAGVLHRVIISDNKGSINIYDNTSAAAPQISFLDTAQGAIPMGTVDFMAPFSNGLTVVTAGDIYCTVIYE